jgi:hypothetical protein
MKKVSTVAVKQSRNISQAKLTIELDLGDRNSVYTHNPKRVNRANHPELTLLLVL